MTDTDAIETLTLTVDAPSAGWSAIRLGDEAVIPLSYIQNIPEDIIDAAKAWTAGVGTVLSLDGEGEIWELHVPAWDASVQIVDADGNLRPTNIPSKVFLLQVLDGMLENANGWAIWQSQYDGEAVDDGQRLDAWNVYIAGRTRGLADRLRAVRDKLAVA